MTATIAIENVKKSYGAITALRGISLQVAAGQFVVLLGPSGCGKTTLLSLIAGFIRPNSGSIVFNGRDMTNLPAYERNLGVVFQDYALFPHMSIAENVAFPLQVRRVPKSKSGDSVAAALDKVDLKGFEHRFPDELSGGQKQRVALARALVFQPSVLLFDEPLGALDRRLRDAMQAELKSLHREVGATFIYVTHDQDEAMAMADTVVVMRDGCIEQSGTPTEIYDQPRTRFVATFVGDCNVISTNTSREHGCLIARHPATGTVVARKNVTDEMFPPDGAQREVALRPEWITVLNGQRTMDPELSRVEGRITQRRFLGREMLLNVDSKLGPMLVQCPRGRGATPEALSESITIAWNPETAVLLSH